ncbi:MAG TPA: hypothetical protein VNN55_02435 [bacterium]|nr:hypothetical protein [bacterium]
MITHYGLYWSERHVFWGRQKRAGQLLGREKTPLARRGAPSSAERGKAGDFRNFVGVYCLYGDGKLLYIGEAGLGTKRTLFARLKKHRKGPLAGRWDRFSWFGRDSASGRCGVKEALAQLEAVSIAIINPGFNKQSGAFAGAIQVFQVPHQEAEGDMETKVDRIARIVSELREAT